MVVVVTGAALPERGNMTALGLLEVGSLAGGVFATGSFAAALVVLSARRRALVVLVSVSIASMDDSADNLAPAMSSCLSLGSPPLSSDY